VVSRLIFYLLFSALVERRLKCLLLFYVGFAVLRSVLCYGEARYLVLRASL